MSTRNLNVINESSHKIRIVDFHGSSFNALNINSIINPKSSVTIGNIDIPKGTHIDGWGPIHSKDIGTNNWGWVYLEDTVNNAQYELFCFAGCTSHVGDRYSIGYKSNQRDIEDPTPNKDEEGYLQAKKDSSGYIFIIKEMPIDSYIFKLGTYTLGFARRNIDIGPFHGKIDAAAHTFVAVTKYDGSNTIYFDCYGGHGSKDDEKANLQQSVVVCRGDKDSLKRAKAICCFNPNGKPNGEENNFSRNFRDVGTFGDGYKNMKAKELFLGNCSGLIYARTGVCHQMANRIFSAATNNKDTDVLGWADVAFGNFTRALFSSHGSIYDIFGENPPSANKFIQALRFIIPSEFAAVVLSFLNSLAPEQLRDSTIQIIKLFWDEPISNEAYRVMEHSERVPLERFPWDKYFEACQDRLLKTTDQSIKA